MFRTGVHKTDDIQLVNLFGYCQNIKVSVPWQTGDLTETAFKS